jgi:hypothetical protein
VCCDNRTKHVNALSGKMQSVFQMLQQVGYERLKQRDLTRQRWDF